MMRPGFRLSTISFAIFVLGALTPVFLVTDAIASPSQETEANALATPQGTVRLYWSLLVQGRSEDAVATCFAQEQTCFRVFDTAFTALSKSQKDEVMRRFFKVVAVSAGDPCIAPVLERSRFSSKPVQYHADGTVSIDIFAHLPGGGTFKSTQYMEEVDGSWLIVDVRNGDEPRMTISNHMEFLDAERDFDKFLTLFEGDVAHLVDAR